MLLWQPARKVPNGPTGTEVNHRNKGMRAEIIEIRVLISAYYTASII